MASTRHAGTLVGRPANVIDDGTMCRMASPVVGPASLGGVAEWPLEKRLMEVGKLSADQLPGEMREQFFALFTPENIGIMVGFIVLVVGAHMSPFAIAAVIADGLTFLVGLVLIGAAVVDVATDLATFAEKTVNARTYSDLRVAADSLARAVSILGITILTAFIAKNASRFGRVAKGGEPIGAAQESARAPRLYEMVKLEHTSDTVMSEALRKAAVKELATENVLAQNPAWEMQSKPGQLKSRGVNAKGEAVRPRQHAESFVEAHKLTVPMGQRTLPAGTEIIQFVRANGKLGVWAAYPGTKPRDLAIVAKGRIQLRYFVERPITVWESTADAFPTGIYEGIGGPGGGLQLWLPKGWQKSVRTVWEAPSGGAFGAGVGATTRQRD